MKEETVGNVQRFLSQTLMSDILLTMFYLSDDLPDWFPDSRA